MDDVSVSKLGGAALPDKKAARELVDKIFESEKNKKSMKDATDIAGFLIRLREEGLNDHDIEVIFSYFINKWTGDRYLPTDILRKGVEKSGFEDYLKDDLLSMIVD